MNILFLFKFLIQFGINLVYTNLVLLSDSLMSTTFKKNPKSDASKIPKNYSVANS